jgi:hypothetical protein
MFIHQNNNKPQNNTIPILKYPGKFDNNFFDTNDKNWNSDLYWKVMFNSCNKYGELYCWLFVDIIYFVVILMNKHKFFIYEYGNSVILGLVIMGTKSITVCWIDLLLVTVDWAGLLLTENCSNCSIFIVFNSRHDVVNINVRHH